MAVKIILTRRGFFLKIKSIAMTFLIAGLYVWCSDLLNQTFNIVFFHPLRGLFGVASWLTFGFFFYFLAKDKSGFPLSIAIFGGLIGMTILLSFLQLLFLLNIITFNVDFFSVYANIALILFISLIIFFISHPFEKEME